MRISKIEEKNFFRENFCQGWGRAEILVKIFLSSILLISTPIVTCHEVMIRCTFQGICIYQSSNMAHQTFKSQIWMILTVFTKLTVLQDWHGENVWKLGCEMWTYVTTNPENIIKIDRLEVSPWGGAKVMLHPVFWSICDDLHVKSDSTGDPGADIWQEK